MAQEERVKLLVRPSWERLQRFVGVLRELPWPKPIQRMGRRSLDRLLARIPGLLELSGKRPRAQPKPRDLSARPLQLALSDLSGSDYRARLRGAQALSQHTGPEVVRALRRCLRDRSVEVSVAAVSSLHIVCGPDARATLEEVLQNADGYYHPLVRAAAVQALGALLPKSEAGLLFSALRDVDAEVSIAAISALAAHAGDGASAALVQVIDNDAGFFLPITRLFAARSLSRMPPLAPGVLDRLRAKETDPQLREILLSI